MDFIVFVFTLRIYLVQVLCDLKPSLARLGTLVPAPQHIRTVNAATCDGAQKEGGARVGVLTGGCPNVCFVTL